MGNGSGIVIRPMGAIAQILNLFQAPKDTIRGVETADLFSPGQPFKPIAPDGAEPRGMQFWPNLNLSYTPRLDAECTAAELKWLAVYPLARICMENVKDLLCEMPRQVQTKPKPGESRKEAAKRGQGDETLRKLNQFFDYPDGEHDWSAWLRPVLDDLLVIDAPAILMRKDAKGNLFELRRLPGESITRLIDRNGYTPAPPSPAYLQVWSGTPATTGGFPWVSLTTDQLIYHPRNIVPRNTMASQLYGMSPTEQLYTELKTGIERLAWVLNLYTAGAIPDAIQMVPNGVAPDKIKEAQEWMTSDLAGNLAKRRGIRLLQGFTEKGDDKLYFPKEEVQADAWDDLHIRKVAFGYGTSATRLLRQMNRASAQQNQEASEEEGTAPWLNWVKSSLCDYLIQRKFSMADAGGRVVQGLPDYEMAFEPRKETDIVKESTALKTYVSSGVMTINEARDQLDQDPLEAEEADEPLIITASGVQPLSIEKQLENQQARQAIMPEPATGNEPPPNPKKKVSKRAVTLDPAHTSPEIVQATQRLRGQVEKVFRRQRDKARDEATRLMKGKLEAAWHTSLQRTGPSLLDSQSSFSSSSTSKIYASASEVPDYVPKAKRKQWMEVWNSAYRRAKAKGKNDKDAESSAFAQANGVAGPSAKVLKAENDKPEEIADDIYAAIAQDFQDIPPEARAAIEQAVLAGISKGMLDLSTADSKLIASANRTAADYAAERAAELVGMKYDAEGNLVENPNAEWAITDTTRDRLREIVKNAFEQDTPISELIDNIADADSFSEQRAELIARTEVSMAQVKGNYEVWKQSGLVKKVKWLISADHDIEDECDSNEDEEVEFGQVFPSGDLMPPAHPRCMCVLVATEVAG